MGTDGSIWVCGMKLEREGRGLEGVDVVVDRRVRLK